MTDKPGTNGSDAHGIDSMDVPDGLLSKLTDLFNHGHLLKNIHESCNYYGIPLDENSAINRTRLVLHIVGITSEWAGEAKWDLLVSELSPVLGGEGREYQHYIERRGRADFPRAWIPCLSRPEAARQYIVRLLGKHGIKIPSSSEDLRGIEPARRPTFNLHGCFEHLLSDRNDKFNRFIYIEKALSCYGIYPGSLLFQQTGTSLADALPSRVVLPSSAPWSTVTFLNSLGMGFELVKDHKGKATESSKLMPWGIELEPPYDVDFFVSLWLGVS